MEKLYTSTRSAPNQINRTLVDIVTQNLAIFLLSCALFMALSGGIYFVLPKKYVAHSTVRVLNAPFDFQTVATSRSVAQLVADQLSVRGGADAIQGSVSVDPIVPRFVYSNTYSDLLAITAEARAQKLAIDVNAKLIQVATDKYQQLDGRNAPVTVIDSPYVTSRRAGPSILTFLTGGFLLGLLVAFALVWARQQLPDQRPSK